MKGSNGIISYHPKSSVDIFFNCQGITYDQRLIHYSGTREWNPKFIADPKANPRPTQKPNANPKL